MENILDFIYYNQFLIIIITMIIGIMAQSYLKSNFTKYSKVRGYANLTGEEVAQRIMNANGVYDVNIERTKITLGDHFDPKNKVVRLSPDVAASNSVAAQAVAAHEVGHVLQYHEGSVLIKARNAFLPIAQISSKGLWGVLIAGFIFQITGFIYLGLIMLAGVLLFQVATLPVEYDASRRAKVQLANLGFVDSNTSEGVGKVLNAAALTYVVAVIGTLMTILRLFSIANRR